MVKEDTEIIDLWKDYKENKSTLTRRKIVLHYIWLVKYVLQTMHLPTNSILEESDFLNIGILGLHDAIEKYQLSRGVKFESYALARIKGTIQDELRRMDWLSRTARKKAHDYLKAGDQLRSQVGRDVTSEEIRNKLKVTPDEYNSYLAAAAAAKSYLSLSESSQLMIADEKDSIEEIPDSSQNLTIESIENEERISFINLNLKKINERKRLIITLYYYENMTFKEIGQVLKVSESRVCQIHGQVLGELRVKLKEFDNG